MPAITFGTVIRLIIACLVVGFVLAFLNITPQDVVDSARGLLTGIWDNAEALFGQTVSYILLGAVIVIPIWLLSYAWKALKRKS